LLLRQAVSLDPCAGHLDVLITQSSTAGTTPDCHVPSSLLALPSNHALSTMNTSVDRFTEEDGAGVVLPKEDTRI